MRILRNYILRELCGAFIMALLMFTLIMVTLNLLRQLTDMIVNQGVNITFVGKLLLYLLPYLFTFTIPMSLLISILFVFGRLSADNEITAIFASGVGLYQIITPVLLIGLLLSAGSVFLNDGVSSRAHFAQRRTIAEMGMQNPGSLLEPGKFIKSFKGYIIFVYSVSGNKLENVRIYQLQEEKKSARTIIAERGEFTSLPEKGQVLLTLINGSLDEVRPREPGFYRVNFKTYSLTLDLAGNLETARLEKKFKDKTINELLEDVDRLQRLNVRPVEPITELHYKLALSFSSFTFVFIGLPLALKIRRREKSVSLGVSLALIVVYWTLLAAGKTLALKGFAPPGISLWTGNILLSAVGISLLRKVTSV